MTEKYIGYLLLSIGICIIGFSVVSMYRVFTRQTQPLQVFSLSGITIDANLLVTTLPLWGPCLSGRLSLKLPILRLLMHCHMKSRCDSYCVLKMPILY